MAKKGVKKIAWNGVGKVHKDKSIPNRIIVIEGGSTIELIVSEWFPNTPEADKKKAITWYRQSADRKIDYFKGSFPIAKPYALTINKATAGKVSFYVEASLTGYKDLSGTTGIYVRAYSPPRVVSSYWRENIEGNNLEINEGNPTQYNIPLHLHLQLEGLNGYNCTVHIYNCEYNLFGDKNHKIRKTYTAKCNGGELDIYIPANDVLQWKKEIGAEKPKERFYIQLSVEGMPGYIKDNTPNADLKHATHLYIENTLGEIISKLVPLPTGNKVIFIGSEEKKPIKYDHCTFSGITISDRGEFTKIFDENDPKTFTIKYERFKFNLKILYDTDQSEIRSDAIPIVNNLVKILKANPKMPMRIESNADERATEDYNLLLSERRAKDLLSYLYTHGVKNKIKIGWNGERYAKKFKYVNNKDNSLYQLNRNTQLSFDSALLNTLYFNTIVPNISVPTNLDIRINKFKTSVCLIEKENVHNNKEAKYLALTNDNYKAITSLPIEGDKLNVEVFADATPMLPLPWHIRPNQFELRINSCRYFPDENSPTIVINAFTDGLWMFHGQYNYSGEYYFKRKGVTQDVNMVKGIDTLYKLVEPYIKLYFENLELLPAGFITAYLQNWVLNYIIEQADLFSLNYTVRYNWVGNSHSEIDYTNKHKIITEIAILTLVLLVMVVEILIIVLTQGKYAQQKLGKILKDAKKVAKEMKQLGFEIIMPKVALNRVMYYEKQIDGNVYFTIEDNIKAEPLIAIYYENVLNLADLLANRTYIDEKNKKESRNKYAGKKNKILAEEEKNAQDEMSSDIQILLDAIGHDAQIKLMFKGSIDAEYNTKISIPVTANQIIQKFSIENILNTKLSNSEGKVIGTETINAEAQLKITSSIKVDEWLPVEIISPGLKIDSKLEGKIGGTISHIRTYGYNNYGPYYKDSIHFAGVKGKVTLSSEATIIKGRKFEILKPKDYNFILFKPMDIVINKIYFF